MWFGGIVLNRKKYDRVRRVLIAKHETPHWQVRHFTGVNVAWLIQPAQGAAETRSQTWETHVCMRSGNKVAWTACAIDSSRDQDVPEVQFGVRASERFPRLSPVLVRNSYLDRLGRTGSVTQPWGLRLRRHEWATSRRWAESSGTLQYRTGHDSRQLTSSSA